jgi:succinate---hydroxymethylglutarate CoA-transferase
VNIASNYLIAGKEASRFGTAHPSIVPYQVFPCKDGFLMIGAANDRQVCILPCPLPSFSPSALLLPSQFRILSAEILELPSMATDPKFASPSERVANRVELCDKIEHRLRQESRDVWMMKFKGKGYLSHLHPCITMITQVACSQGPIRANK